MLKDSKEIEIISNARQVQVRNPERSRKHFEDIFNDFLSGIDLEKKLLLDLGPGQFDFAEIVRPKGGIVHSIDNDPAVIELGEYKGLNVRLDNLKKLPKIKYDFKFDAVFCKYSINAFWFHDNDAKHTEYVESINNLMKADGFAWIAPWNGVPKKAQLSDREIQRVLDLQADLFRDFGFTGINLTKKLTTRYGIHGITANQALFFRNLDTPKGITTCEKI
jgi:hypothetical protein